MAFKIEVEGEERIEIGDSGMTLEELKEANRDFALDGAWKAYNLQTGKLEGHNSKAEW